MVCHVPKVPVRANVFTFHLFSENIIFIITTIKDAISVVFSILFRKCAKEPFLNRKRSFIL